MECSLLPRMSPSPTFPRPPIFLRVKVEWCLRERLQRRTLGQSRCLPASPPHLEEISIIFSARSLDVRR